MRSSLLSLLVVVAAGCAGTADESSLVWSDDVVRSMDREGGDVVEVARFSQLRPGERPDPWEPWMIVRGNKP